ncbi:hypothetical protein [Sphingobacterium lactis]|uniref:hypothetical protein n=1 Tax=Sphingobacterium lactis TaxID=797291 RepID=UPI003DA3302A
MNRTTMQNENVNRILLPFLRLKEDSYSLDLTEEKANELGISQEELDTVRKSLEEINNFIREAKNDPDHELSLFDPEAKETAGVLQTMPSGNLSSNGQETVGAGFFAPFGATKVRFTCKANAAPLAFYTCRTHSFGITKTGSGTGSAFVSTVVDVALAASNVNASVDFRTSDPNGGVCSWQVIV